MFQWIIRFVDWVLRSALIFLDFSFSLDTSCSMAPLWVEAVKTSSIPGSTSWVVSSLALPALLVLQREVDSWVSWNSGAISRWQTQYSCRNSLVGFGASSLPFGECASFIYPHSSSWRNALRASWSVNNSWISIEAKSPTAADVLVWLGCSKLNSIHMFGAAIVIARVRDTWPPGDRHKLSQLIDRFSIWTLK